MTDYGVAIEIDTVSFVQTPNVDDLKRKLNELWAEALSNEYFGRLASGVGLNAQKLPRECPYRLVPAPSAERVGGTAAIAFMVAATVSLAVGLLATTKTAPPVTEEERKRMLRDGLRVLWADYFLPELRMHFPLKKM